MPALSEAMPCDERSGSAMSLNKAVAHDVVRLLGFTDPRSYDSGTFAPREGGTIAFAAGVSMKVCVGSGEHDFNVLKVRTANVPAVVSVIGAAKLGDLLDIEYFEGRDGNNPELVDCGAHIGK